MEGRIKFLSNDIADELVINSKNSSNSLSLIIPYEYVKEKISVNWSDMLFLISNGYLYRTSAIEYAIEMMSVSTDNRIIYLACTDKNDVFEELFWRYIKSLADELTQELKKESKIKVMYVLLSWLYDNRLSIEDPIHILDIIYDDFGFPLVLEKIIDKLHSLDKAHNHKTQVYSIWYELLGTIRERLETRTISGTQGIQRDGSSVSNESNN